LNWKQENPATVLLWIRFATTTRVQFGYWWFMFTGLVEACGEVTAVQPEGPAVRLTIAVPESLTRCEDRVLCRTGDSVAVNGCCLTVVDINGANWSFQAGAETLAKTNLGELKPGDPVNLERPLKAGGELGGHFVQGHIDGVATVDVIETDGEWTTMWFGIPREFSAFLVPKGSVAVDGVSLTVVQAEADRFSVALIPHTLQVTTLGLRCVGETVNIETDILAKYVERLLARHVVERNTE